MCSYLVYPSFPLIGVVGAICDSDDLPGASGSKVQMVVLHGAVSTTVPVSPLVTPCIFLEVSWCSCSLLCNTSVARACSHGDCLHRALSAEVTPLSLLW